MVLRYWDHPQHPIQCEDSQLAWVRSLYHLRFDKEAILRQALLKLDRGDESELGRHQGWDDRGGTVLSHWQLGWGWQHSQEWHYRHALCSAVLCSRAHCHQDVELHRAVGQRDEEVCWWLGHDYWVKCQGQERRRRRWEPQGRWWVGLNSRW